MGGGSCPLRLSIYNRSHAREGFESSSSSIVLVDFIIKCMDTMKMELAEIYRRDQRFGITITNGMYSTIF